MFFYILPSAALHQIMMALCVFFMGLKSTIFFYFEIPADGCFHLHVEAIMTLVDVGSTAVYRTVTTKRVGYYRHIFYMTHVSSGFDVLALRIYGEKETCIRWACWIHGKTPTNSPFILVNRKRFGSQASSSCDFGNIMPGFLCGCGRRSWCWC